MVSIGINKPKHVVVQLDSSIMGQLVYTVMVVGPGTNRLKHVFVLMVSTGTVVNVLAVLRGSIGMVMFVSVALVGKYGTVSYFCVNVLSANSGTVIVV